MSVSLPARVRGAVGRFVRIIPGFVDPARLSLTWHAAGLPAGLSINPATGIITGVPSHPARVHLSVTAITSRGGSATAATTLTIAGAPQVTSTLTAPDRGRVVLAVRAAAGRFASGLERLVITPHGLVSLGSLRQLARLVSVYDRRGHRLRIALARRRAAIVVTLRVPVRIVALRLAARTVVAARRAVATVATAGRPGIGFTVAVS